MIVCLPCCFLSNANEAVLELPLSPFVNYSLMRLEPKKELPTSLGPNYTKCWAPKPSHNIIIGMIHSFMG